MKESYGDRTLSGGSPRPMVAKEQLLEAAQALE